MGVASAGAKVAVVETVTGPVPVASLGPTLMHEHIFSLYSEVRVQDSTWNEEERVADAAAQIRSVHGQGIRTIVDHTVYGLGRNVDRIRKVAERSGITIVAATGLYFFTELPDYFLRRMEVEGPRVIEDLFVNEVEVGIFQSGIKAAFIKVATGPQGVTPHVDVALRSAARAQLRTNVPISTHSHPQSRNGLAQQRIFREEGVDLGRVIIGHCGDTVDVGYLEQLLDGGSYLGMDRFGSRRPPILDDRVRTVATLCERGYADRIVMSHDTNCWSDKVPSHLRGVRPESTMAPYTYLVDEVLPRLREAGVSEQDIHQMMVENPQTIFRGAQ